MIRRTYEGTVAGFGRSDALALFRRLLIGERGAYWTFVVHTGNGGLRRKGGGWGRTGGRWWARAPRCTCGCRADGRAAGAGGRGRRRGTDRRNRRDEPHQRNVPLSRGRPDGRGSAHLPRGRQGDRGVVDGRRRGAQDDVHGRRHGRGRRRTAPEGDGPPRSHGVRAARQVHPRRARGAEGDHVRGDRHRLTRAERLPRDRAPREGRPWLLRGALALLGRDAGGPDPRLPHPHPDRRHRRRRTAAGSGGATLVRGSDPASEVAETHAKAAGVLAALGARPARPRADANAPGSATTRGCGRRSTAGVAGSPRSGCG